MATPEQKAFCVLHFVEHESVVSVQQAFRRQFNNDPSSPNSIRRWYQQFQTTGCLCKGKSAGRPCVSKESVEQVRQSFLPRPKKSVHCASRELEMSSMTVWRVLRKRLLMKPHRLHLLQLLKPTVHIDRSNFCIKMQDAITEEGFLDRVVFSDESTFHISGKVNKHNVRIWGTENPLEIVQHERASPKINVFCAKSTQKVYGPFFFCEDTVMGASYLEMLQIWLFPRMQEDEPEDFIMQQDGAPPHFRLDVHRWVNDILPHRWIGRGAHEDLMFCPWPAWSPD